MPRAIPEKAKLTAIAYTIAGLDNKTAAAKAGVSYGVLLNASKDKLLRRKAMQLYLRAVEDARAVARPRTRSAKAILRDQREAARVATLPKPARHAYAKRKAAEVAARKVVVVQQQPILVLAEEDEEDSMDLATTLERLKRKFKVKDTRGTHK